MWFPGNKSILYIFVIYILSTSHLAAGEDSLWTQAQQNGTQTRDAFTFCRRFVQGWLAFSDPTSGLIPRNLKTDYFWNTRDSAADNYPFMVLTAYMTGDHVMKPILLDMLKTEKKLTSRWNSLPDDFLFETQTFRTNDYKMDDLIFGAAEYAKDGLIPITEWLGSSPWLERLEEMIQDIWKEPAYDSAVGRIPTKSVEVAGDLLQAMSRLYWLTGKEEYRQWAFRLADQYLLHDNIPQWARLQLDDHGCEIIGGLAETYYIAWKTDPARRERYTPKIHAILDRVLEVARNTDGLLYNVVNAQSGQVINTELTDNWGYNYNAFLTVAEIDGIERYREAVRFVLSNIHKNLDYQWEGGGADGYADSIEGCLNLVNRIPDPGALQWIDASMKILLAKQNPNGIIEGWHGDGNSARTTLMYALWKTQGVTVSPWREDLSLGAVCDTSGTLYLNLTSGWPWQGQVVFDHPRHRDYFHMPSDYPRLNQFPEWFTIEKDKQYRLWIGNPSPTSPPNPPLQCGERGGESQLIEGEELYQFPARIQPDKPLMMKVAPL